MKLVLLRHGESLWNQENRFTGWTDVPLTEKGRQEAIEAGRLLKTEKISFDVCYTSYLKRAIQTLNLVLQEMDAEWSPVYKDWRLNERHYGNLQGLNKNETAEKYGEDQVKIWRRSYDVRPPFLEETDDRNPAKNLQYKNIPKEDLPLSESLKDTEKRVSLCFETEIIPQIKKGKNVLITAHGNSLRALIMKLECLNPKEILNLNLPTGIPIVYELNCKMEIKKRKYLGDSEWVKEKIDQVAAQGMKKEMGMSRKKEVDSFYTASREGYLIAVYLLQKEKGYARSIDISEMLGYTKPSVSNGIHSLIENNLLSMDSNRYIQFTDQGRKKAEEIYWRYQIVKDYFQVILGIDEKTAEQDSRKIQHIVSPKTIKKMQSELQKNR